MNGVVTATGMNTYFGKTAHLVEQAKTVSHFQRAVLRIGNFLILVTIGLVLVIGLAALFRHDPLLETLQFALILTVASIPVALPAVLSVTMAVGAERLAGCKAIVVAAGRDRGDGRHGHAVQRQDRNADQERAHARAITAGTERRRATICCSRQCSRRRRDAPDAIDAAILAGAPAGHTPCRATR